MFEEQKIYAKWIKKGMKGIITGSVNSIKRETDTLKPRWLWIATTDLCNSRCTFCNIWENRKTHENMSPQEIEKYLSDPICKDVEYIINSGGESTTRTDLTEFMLAEHKAIPKAKLNLSTNALMPERAYNTVKACLEAGAKVEGSISLDGIGEDHDKLRGVKGNFEKVDKLITLYQELQKQYPKTFEIATGSVLVDNTIPNIEEVKEYCRRRHIPFAVQWYNATPYYNNVGTEQEHMKQEAIKILKNFPPDLIMSKWVDWLNGKPIRFKCYSLYNFCVIKSDSTIVPCLTHWDAPAGRLRENTFSEIWNNKNNPNMKETREIVRQCQGCLNSWGFGWSHKSNQFQYIKYYLQNPKILSIRVKEETDAIANTKQDKGDSEIGDFNIGVG
ncbi:MAG: radical SAM protein [Candidatus Micrarchaeaceae archaeon]